jgi:hypothetical protein
MDRPEAMNIADEYDRMAKEAASVRAGLESGIAQLESLHAATSAALEAARGFVEIHRDLEMELRSRAMIDRRPKGAQ